MMTPLKEKANKALECLQTRREKYHCKDDGVIEVPPKFSCGTRRI